MQDDRGAGSVLAVALVGGIAALTAMVLPLSVGLATRQSVSAAADAAALAAADTASGLVPGYPCEVAEKIAAANGTAVATCAVDGLVVTVSASRDILGITVLSTATAGPDGGGTD